MSAIIAFVIVIARREALVSQSQPRLCDRPFHGR